MPPMPLASADLRHAIDAARYVFTLCCLLIAAYDTLFFTI